MLEIIIDLNMNEVGEFVKKIDVVVKCVKVIMVSVKGDLFDKVMFLNKVKKFIRVILVDIAMRV